ncbi:DNA alkylation repair enzyme [Agreia bicolorata]|uniref:DNA alkylation repair enzyme n=1 Tax=Agreia bicolorata TaxID=110935 RepID=A0A1T4XUP1_9MICO|nr:DNA alkylation repair protein [Agreia bicolorata]SKA93224.1 DNA alkylation repair enzyme [Agreia bicolorata]
MASQRIVEACELVDEALQYESSWQRAEEHRARFGGVGYYGTSVGAIRASLRDTLRRFPELTHDEITALSSLLWAADVYERRLAAVILLQSRLDVLIVSDLTRLEGFLRSGTVDELSFVLARDVIRPLVLSLGDRDRARAESVVARWSESESPGLRRAAQIAAADS